MLAKLEVLAEQSRPVINMPFAACDDILRPGKYRNYHQRIDSGERDPAAARDHADREMVGARLYPMYNEHIHYAALSPDGRGLSGYGPIAVRWQVTPDYLGRRASLLDENSFTFYEHNSLGTRGAAIPSGHRGTWEDRVKLVSAKLSTQLTTATGESSLPDLLLRVGPTRIQDIFIEIAIYADGGLDTQDVDMVTLHSAATTPEEAHRKEIVREMCAFRRIVFVE